MVRPKTTGRFNSRPVLVSEILRLRNLPLKLDAVAWEVKVAISTVHRILRENGL